MRKNTTFPLVLAGVAVLFCVVMFQGLAASTTNFQSPISLFSDQTNVDPVKVLSELNQKNQELDRVTLAIANAREKEPIIADRVDQLKVIFAQLEFDLKNAQTELKSANAQQQAFEETYSDHVSQIRSDVARHQVAQLDTQSQRFQEIEGARKARNELRARIGAQKEDQEEALRERQLKKEAAKETEDRVASARTNAFNALSVEKNAIYNRVISANNRIASLTNDRDNTAKETESSRQLLAELHSTLDAGGQTVSRLNNEIASLEQLKRYLPETRAESVQQTEMAASYSSQQLDVRSNPSWSASAAFARPASNGYTSPVLGVQSQPFGGTDYAASTRRFDPTYRPPVGEHTVRGYHRKDGTYVRSHARTNPDSSFWNNHSSLGNVNPHTGRIGRQLPKHW